VFAALSSFALGLFHMPPVWTRVFSHWNTEMDSLSQLTQKLINTVLVAFGLALMILGSLTTLLFIETSAGGVIRAWFLLFCSVFWLWRTIWQVAYFPYRKLNPRRELLLFHVGLIVTFVINTVAYLVPAIAMFLG
jgi:hypothetical protein